MIKIFNYNQIMQNEVENFIVKNMNNELEIIDKKILINITKDLKNIKESYIESGGEMLFAYDDEAKKIVGTVAIKFENGVAILKRFYVDENYRKRKIGYLLYVEIEKEIKKRAIDKIYLTTGKELKSAHKFYERNGWVKEDSNPGIYVRNGADLYIKKMKGSVEMIKSSDILKQADILIEAIPYIKEYVGKIMVIKYGGNVMSNNEQKENVIKQVALLKMLGIKVVLIHGGGPDIEEELKLKKVESKFENGLRVTDENTMEIVRMVLIGKTNSEIVKLLNLQQCNAIGLSGVDNSFIKCKKENEKIGFVGKVERVDTNLLLDLLEKNYVPVISPIGVDDSGNYYNINADTVASEIAIAIKAKKIIFLTNIDGILDKNMNLIPLINKKQINNLIENKVITGGMLPKIKACEKCLNSGVEKTHILNGSKKNTVLYELLSDKGVGTMII